MPGFNTQPPEGGWEALAVYEELVAVSTHSRPKAAGFRDRHFICDGVGFNTQPPEGGWIKSDVLALVPFCFNTQPPEGGWALIASNLKPLWEFQHTAARRRLGGDPTLKGGSRSFNTQPPEGGWHSARNVRSGYAVSTHSRPKAAGQLKFLRIPP